MELGDGVGGHLMDKHYLRQRLAARRHLSVASLSCALDHHTQAYFIQRIAPAEPIFAVFLRLVSRLAKILAEMFGGNEPKSL